MSAPSPAPDRSRRSRAPEPRGGILYLPVEQAAAAIDALDRDRLAVIGMDGALLRPGETRPQLDFIADYSDALDEIDDWPAYRARLNQASRDLTAVWAQECPELYVELVTCDEQSWRCERAPHHDPKGRNGP